MNLLPLSPKFILYACFLEMDMNPFFCQLAMKLCPQRMVESHCRRKWVLLPSSHLLHGLLLAQGLVPTPGMASPPPSGSSSKHQPPLPLASPLSVLRERPLQEKLEDGFPTSSRGQFQASSASTTGQCLCSSVSQAVPFTARSGSLLGVG